MSIGREIERLIVRFVGDTKQYLKALKEVNTTAERFVKDERGRWRNVKGQFVSTQKVIQQQAQVTLNKIRALSQGLKQAGANFKKFGEWSSQKGRSMTWGASLPLLGGATLAANKFADYEEVLDRIVGLAGVARGEIAGVDKQLRSMSVSLATDPQELVEGFYFIASSGIKGARAMETLEVSAKAARAGLGETKVVADAITSAINAYGPANMTAAKAADILTAAVREGKGEADEIAPVLGRLLPTASALKIGFEQVAGAMAVMSRTGLDAAEASTSVGAIMSTLLKPSEGAEKLLAGLGVTMGQLRKQAAGPNGLIMVMRTLDQAFKKLGTSDEAQAMMAEIMPNIRAFRGAMNVLAQDAGVVDQVMSSVANSAGTANAAFQEGEKSLKRGWQRGMAEMSTALLALGEALTPHIQTLAKHIAEIAKWFKALSKDTQAWIVQIGIVTGLMGPFLMVMGGAINAISSLVGGFHKLTSALGMGAKSMGALRIATLSVGAAVAGISLARWLAGTQQITSELERQKKLMDELLELERKRQGKVLEQSKKDKEGGKGHLSVAALQERRKQLRGSLEVRENQLRSARKALSDFQLMGREGDTSWVSDSLSKQNLGVTDYLFPAKGLGKIARGLVGDSPMGKNLLDKALGGPLEEMLQADVEEAKSAQEEYKRQLDEINKELENVFQGVGTGKGKGGAGVPELTKMRDLPLTEKVNEMIAQLEKGKTEMETLFKGKGMGLTDEQIQRFQEVTDLEKELAKSQSSLTSEEYDRLNVINKELSAMEKQKKLMEEQEKAQENMAGKAAKILQDNLTPIQKLTQDIQEVQAMMGAGALTGAEGKTAINRLMKDYGGDKQDSVLASGGKAVLAGTAEAQSLTQFNRVQDKAERGIWELVSKQKIQVKTEAQILAEMRKLNTKKPGTETVTMM